MPCFFFIVEFIEPPTGGFPEHGERLCRAETYKIKQGFALLFCFLKLVEKGEFKNISNFFQKTSLQIRLNVIN